MMIKLIKSSAIALGYFVLQPAIADDTRYRIEVVTAPEEFKSSFPVAINNEGNVASAFTMSSGNRFEYPVDTSMLDFKDTDSLDAITSRLGTTSVEAAYINIYWDSIRKGQFVSNSLGAILSYLSTYNGDGQHQQLATIRSGYTSDNELEELSIFDSINDETDEYNYFHDEQVHGINSLSWLVGDTKSPLTQFEFNDETWLMPEFINRGFVKFTNNAITLKPPYDEVLGGFSYATAISDSGYVVGYASVDGTTSLDSLVDSCEDNNDLVPEEVCYWRNLNGSRDAQFRLFNTHAYLWKVNANGEITERKDLGIAIEESEFATSASYYSRAFAVNDIGQVVGDSHMLDLDDNVRQQAALFYQDNVFIITNPQIYPQSRAVDINNNGIVIGTMYDSAGLGIVQKSFYYDLNASALEVTPLDDFFVSANTKAKSINDNGIIVGVTDADGLASGTKPKHGFIYDTSIDEMYDLNDMLSCETDFTIVDAVSINDDGVILARASYTQTARDLMGNTISNSITGESAIEQVEYTVRLVPDMSTGGTCNLPDTEVTVKRQGASLSGQWFFIFFITFLFKKYYSNRKTI